MNLNKDQILNFLRENKNTLEKEFGVTKIALFGSYARGEADINSDIDFLIEVRKKDFRKRFYLKEFLEKNFNRNVDVGYFDSLKKFIRKKVEEELIYA